MKEKSFRPLLAPNKKTDLDKLSYPVLGSYKLDGCRMVSYNGELKTRSLKDVQNKQINEKFEPLRKFSEKGLLLDGEIYVHGIPFGFIVSCFMTQDYTKKLAIKKWDELCLKHKRNITREEVLKSFRYYLFDNVN